jgi:hypothetical protein
VPEWHLGPSLCAEFAPHRPILAEAIMQLDDLGHLGPEAQAKPVEQAAWNRGGR